MKLFVLVDTNDPEVVGVYSTEEKAKARLVEYLRESMTASVADDFEIQECDLDDEM
jgi:hypothetical protein